MGIALMKKDRLAELRGHTELTLERSKLRIAGREVPKVIEPAFSYGNGFPLRGEFE